MILWLNEKLNGDDEGFTLIELMVVVLIIAILIAIAIPTFLGARRRAQDRQAQSNLRNALTAEKTYYADAQNYATDDVAAGLTALRDIEANLAWNTDDAAARGVNVEARSTDFQVVLLGSLSKSGSRFCIADASKDGATGTTAGTPLALAGTYYTKAASANATACPGIADTTWVSTTAGWS